MLQLRQKPRRFICKRCNKKSKDSMDEKPLDKDVTFEDLDLCKKCFKEYKKEMQQTYTLIGLVQTGRVSKDEMEILHKYQIDGNKKAFNKLKSQLLQRGNYSKGHLKNKKSLMILNLKKNTIEMHNRVNFIKEFC